MLAIFVRRVERSLIQGNLCLLFIKFYIVLMVNLFVIRLNYYITSFDLIHRNKLHKHLGDSGHATIKGR